MHRTRMSRFASALGVVIALSAALLSSTQVATATSGTPVPDPSPEVVYATAADRPIAMDTPASQTAAAPRVTPRALRSFNGNCQFYAVCIWRDNNYRGSTIVFTGDYNACEGWRFEGTGLQDHVFSFENLASGRVSVWNRFADGSFNYHKLGSFPSGFEDGHEFSRTVDAWVYDPHNNCTRLNLHWVTD